VSKPVTQTITRKSASNLALAFILLPRDQRLAMAALYAFCRVVDDVADDEEINLDERRSQLAAWRDDVARACQGVEPHFAVNQELRRAIVRYQLPFEHFDELLRGVEMDLDIKRYPTYADLDLYCHRVASVVGLLSIEIFGYRNPACRDYAIALGRALQLTNILRDVGSDAQRQRIYLPLEELERFHVSPDEILQRQDSDRFRQLAASVADRARAWFRTASDLLPPVDRRSMIAAELMGSVYWHLLGELQTRRFDVLASPAVRLSKGVKLYLVLRTWFRVASGKPIPNYGCP
jgi:15-cis-phytoene synthase